MSEAVIESERNTDKGEENSDYYELGIKNFYNLCYFKDCTTVCMSS